MLDRWQLLARHQSTTDVLRQRSESLLSRLVKRNTQGIDEIILAVREISYPDTTEIDDRWQAILDNHDQNISSTQSQVRSLIAENTRLIADDIWPKASEMSQVDADTSWLPVSNVFKDIDSVVQSELSLVSAIESIPRVTDILSTSLSLSSPLANGSTIQQSPGFYIEDSAGNTQKLIQQNQRLTGNEKMLSYDIDRDSDQDILYSLGRTLYIKENISFEPNANHITDTPKVVTQFRMLQSYFGITDEQNFIDSGFFPDAIISTDYNTTQSRYLEFLDTDPEAYHFRSVLHSRIIDQTLPFVQRDPIMYVDIFADIDQFIYRPAHSDDFITGYGHIATITDADPNTVLVFE